MYHCIFENTKVVDEFIKCIKKITKKSEFAINNNALDIVWVS